MSVNCWLARDLDGDLYLHFSEPKEDYVSKKFWISHNSVNVSKTKLDENFSFIAPGSYPILLNIDAPKN